MKDQIYFSKQSLDYDQFKQSLVAVSDKAKAKCKSCNKVFNLSNMGKQALVSHAAGKKHMAVTTKVQMFFKPKVTQEDLEDSEKSRTNKDDNTSIIEENPPEKVPSTLHLIINNSSQCLRIVLLLRASSLLQIKLGT